MLSQEGLKKTEIEVSKFFGWNFCFFSVYDYLELFLALGCLLGSDRLRVDIKGTPNAKNGNQVSAQRSQRTPRNGESPKVTSFQSNKGLCKVIAIDSLRAPNSQRIARNIEKRALELVSQLSIRFIIDPRKQKEAAYLVIV